LLKKTKGEKIKKIKKLKAKVEDVREGERDKERMHIIRGDTLWTQRCGSGMRFPAALATVSAS
jgi:hypothetical protein